MSVQHNFVYTKMFKLTIKNLYFFLVVDVDNVLQRMTIVGVILSFRQLAQAALVDVLEERVPFLLSSVLDFRQHAPPGDTGNLADQLVCSFHLSRERTRKQFNL